MVLLVVGVATVPPLALGGDWRPWLAAATSAGAALALPVGPWGAVVATPWLALATHAALQRRARPASWAATPHGTANDELARWAPPDTSHRTPHCGANDGQERWTAADMAHRAPHGNANDQPTMWATPDAALQAPHGNANDGPATSTAADVAHRAAPFGDANDGPATWPAPDVGHRPPYGGADDRPARWTAAAVAWPVAAAHDTGHDRPAAWAPADARHGAAAAYDAGQGTAGAAAPRVDDARHRTAAAYDAGQGTAGAAAPRADDARRRTAATHDTGGGVAGEVGRQVAGVYGMVAAAALVVSRLGLELAGVGEPFVLLTAVHYLFAGCGALTLATWVGGRLGMVAVAATAVAPPVVAAGFVLDAPVLQVGGAAVLTVGACATGVGQLAAARRVRCWHRSLLALSGFAPWVPMGLAVAWAAGAGISVPQMARTHGVVNALAFTIAGLAARRLPADVTPHTPVIGRCLAWGAGVGAGCGAAAGAWFFLVGAIYGAPIGAVVGLVAAVPVTPFVLRACRRATSPLHLAAQLSLLFEVVVAVLLVPVVGVAVACALQGGPPMAAFVLVVGTSVAVPLLAILVRAQRSLVRAWYPVGVAA